MTTTMTLTNADERLTARPTIVRLAELQYTPDGLTRGHAHVGLPDYPAGAPGHLDLSPLLLFASGENHPGERFEMHRHENIENVMVMLQGAVRHRDSQGATGVVRSDDVTVLSAGRGIEHEEAVLGDEPLRALVIWLRPRHDDLDPVFVHGTFPRARRRGGWQVLASGRPAGDALPLSCDAEVRATILAPGEIAAHDVAPGRRAYAIVLDGAVDVGGSRVSPGERFYCVDAGALSIVALAPAEIVLVDMAGP